MIDIEAHLGESQQSINALKVLKRLNDAGYDAYLVGGCVRDLLLGRSPKDFDVATDAHPEEVADLFRNSRMVGRRFKIVHVRFGRDIVEVATFRAPHQDNTGDNFSDGGMILSDNIYGTFEEDVERRDFAMNALYYDARDQRVIDEVDGLKDLEAKQIRLIGDPEERYREDPVRMLRAARFQAKLGFAIEPSSRTPILKLGHLLHNIPPARLFEEVLKLFMSGHGEASLQALHELELLGWLFPHVGQAKADSRAFRLARLALASTDRRIADDMPVTPAFVLAALMWWPFVEEKQRIEDEGAPPLAASHEAALHVIAQQQFIVSIPRRFSGPMRDIWHLQFRLPNTRGKKPRLLLAHKRFRAAYDFLLLREESGEELNDLGAWWTRFQEQVAESPEGKPEVEADRPRRRRRRKRRPRSQE